MFGNGVGFQTLGGNFYDVQSGDVNLHTHLHLTLQDQTLNHAALQAPPPTSTALVLEDGCEADGSGRELSRVARNRRRTVAPGLTLPDMASLRHISLARSPLCDHEDCLLPLESNSHAIMRPSSRRPTSDPSSDTERIPESSNLAISTSTSHPSAAPQYPLHAARPPAPTDLSTPPIPNRPFSHPPPSGFTSSGGNPDPSSGRDNPGHLLSCPTLFQGVPAQSAQGGTFISAQNVNHNYCAGDRGMDILHNVAALEALYDSAESFPQPKCHPDTCTGILDDLYNWAVGSASSGLSIGWLNGPAGAGKSAIMQTLCQRLQDEGHLGGSFFFKRGHSNRGNARLFFVTLAYQLAIGIQSLKGPISQNTENDPSVVARSMGVMPEIARIVTGFSPSLPPPS